MGNRDPPIPTAMLQPLLVRTIRRKEIVVTLYGEPGGGKDPGKRLTEIPIGEIDPGQAACSYRTACSISAGLNP